MHRLNHPRLTRNSECSYIWREEGMGWSAGSAVSARPVCFPMHCLSTNEDIVCVDQGPVREVGPIGVELDLDMDTVMEMEVEEEGEMDLEMEMEMEGEMEMEMEEEGEMDLEMEMEGKGEMGLEREMKMEGEM